MLGQCEGSDMGYKEMKISTKYTKGNISITTNNWSLAQLKKTNGHSSVNIHFKWVVSFVLGSF